MSSAHYDVIVIGAELLGRSAACALSKSGKRILVLESGGEVNPNAASYGNVRVTRRINEEPILNKTAAASREAMEFMQEETGINILQPMPAVFMMKKPSDAYTGITQGIIAAERKVEEISRDEIIARYRVYPNEGCVGIVDSDAATFNPAEVLKYQRKIIEERGGTFYFNTPVTSWTSDEKKGAEVRTKDFVFFSEQIVIATGAWAPDVLARGNGDYRVISCLSDAMVLQRVPVFYFDYPDIPLVIPIIMADEGNIDMYAMQEIRSNESLFKVGFHYGDPVASPGKINREIGQEEVGVAQRYVEGRLRQKLNYRDHHVCHYAKLNAKLKDPELPLIGALPESANVYVIIYGGGTGGKHAPAWGRALGQIMCGEEPDFDMRVFAPGRVLPEGLLQQLHLPRPSRVKAHANGAFGL